jgi:hypothetical protein
VDARTLDWLDILGRGLLWGSVAVLGLSVIGAVAILTTDSVIGLFEDVQRQGRAILAVGAFGGGLTASGVLAGLGAIIRLEVAEHRQRRGR